MTHTAHYLYHWDIMAFDYPTIIGTCHNMVYVYINIYIYMMGILKLDSTIPLSHGGITSHSCLRHCIQSSLNSCHDL